MAHNGEAPEALPSDLPELPAGWKWKPLRDYVHPDRAISYGIVQPGDHDSTGVPILRAENVQNSHVELQDVMRVSQAIESRYKRTRLKGGEVLITLVGAYFGKVAVAPKSAAGYNTARAVGVVPVVSDELFLCYALQSPICQRYIQTWATTTAQPTLNLGDVARIPIPSPSPETRAALAAVLGALDDKIELNRRMNPTLEAMARALFQSWFVDFDPVRAKLDGRKPTGLDAGTAALFPNEFEHSELGPIPKGWDVRPLSYAFDIKDGATFRKEDRLEHEGLIAYGANGPVGFSARANVSEPCIALGKIGSCGSLCRSWNPCWVTNNAFIVKPHHGGSLEFVWRTLCTIEVSQFIGGSANPYMPLKNFGHTRVVMPPEPLLKAYQERAGKLATKIVANENQSRTLATLRDTLLPKLLSGEVPIPTAICST